MKKLLLFSFLCTAVLFQTKAQVNTNLTAEVQIRIATQAAP